LSALVAGSVRFHRRVILLGGVPGTWIAVACLLTVARVQPPAAGLAVAALALAPYAVLLAARRSLYGRLPLPGAWAAWLASAVHEEEDELAEAIRPAPGTWRDGLAVTMLLAVVVAASITMEQTAAALGRRYGVADIITGAVVLAVVTSLPNAVSAVYLARRGRGAAVLSTALNSNAINATAGLLIPATVVGLGAPGGQDLLVTAWYAGLTVLALALAWHGRGLGRLPGALVIAGYLAFTAALAISVARHAVSPVTAAVPAAAIAAAGAVLLAWPSRDEAAARWRGKSVLPGWDTGRLWKFALLTCSAVAACDAATGPHLVLIGVLAAGPCCALLTARWALTAAVTGYALALGTVLGVPDHIFATAAQYALLAAVAAAGTAATAGAVVLQRQQA
jgi:hypothetical protein